MHKPRCEIHLYKRIKRDSGHFFKCQRCPHYIHQDFVIGRSAECWYCKNTFLMTVKSLIHKPHCGCQLGTRPERIKDPKKKSKSVQLAREAVFASLIKKLG